jgi:hypothetical protein
MRRELAAGLVAMALLGGCKARSNQDTGALRSDTAGVDTSFKSGSVRDTTVVKTDTNVNKDTTKKTEHIKKDSQ